MVDFIDSDKIYEDMFEKLGEKMKLTSEIAIKILEDARGKTKDDKWIEHCICVGNSAGKIAEALNKKELM